MMFNDIFGAKPWTGGILEIKGYIGVRVAFAILGSTGGVSLTVTHFRRLNFHILDDYIFTFLTD